MSVGRPPIEITQEMCDKAEALAAQGLSRDQIADVLGFSRTTLFNKMNENSDFLDAIKRGSSKGVATIANALFQSAKGGNTTAQIFYLKNRAPVDWRDRRDHTISGDQDNPLITRIERAVVDGNPKNTDG